MSASAVGSVMASKRAAGKEAAGICFADTNYRKKKRL